jgi:hypothetical protein
MPHVSGIWPPHNRTRPAVFSGDVTMNRNVLIGAVVILLAAGGYYYYSNNMVDAPAAATTEGTAPAATTETAPAATTETAPAATTETAPAATTETAPAATTETAPDAMAATPALDAATFDPVAVAGMIDASPLDDATKTTLKAAVTAAGSNPALVDGAIAQVKAALGM